MITIISSLRSWYEWAPGITDWSQRCFLDKYNATAPPLQNDLWLCLRPPPLTNFLGETLLLETYSDTSLVISGWKTFMDKHYMKESLTPPSWPKLILVAMNKASELRGDRVPFTACNWTPHKEDDFQSDFTPPQQTLFCALLSSRDEFLVSPPVWRWGDSHITLFTPRLKADFIPRLWLGCHGFCSAWTTQSQMESRLLIQLSSN